CPHVFTIGSDHRATGGIVPAEALDAAIDAMQDCPVGAIVLLPASPSCP
ncbi:MAG: ferredoxin, partial [Selenomonas sp.]|nr:ferredoxin [Selenomonas sp.]